MIQRAEKQTMNKLPTARSEKHLYPTIGLVFGLGLLVGFLVHWK